MLNSLEQNVIPMAREELNKYYSLSKKLYDNPGDTGIVDDEIHDFYIEGLDLWNRLFNKWRDLYNAGDTKAQKYERMPMEDGKPRLLKKFIDFLVGNGASGAELKKMFFCLGEGRAMTNSAPDVIDLADKIEGSISVDIVCGPVMVQKDKSNNSKTAYDCLNEFLAELLKCSETGPENKIKLKLWVNKFVSLREGFAGYFHAYIIGGGVLFENMHRISAKSKKMWFFIKDDELFESTNEFFTRYRNKFARPLEFEELNDDTLDTIASSFYTCTNSNYVRVFDDDYADDLLSVMEA